LIDLSTCPQWMIDFVIDLIDFFGLGWTGVSGGVALA